MSRALRGGWWIPLATVVLVQGWWLRSELRPGSYPNDGSFHRAYLDWAATRLAHGHSPLDGIFPQLGLGFPVFQHYQVLPHLLLAPVAVVLGSDLTYGLSLALLVALWPLCVYAAARLFELDRTSAVAAAVLAPLVTSTPGYGFEVGSYVWRGWGMWSQAWGMWLFALAAACVWRAVFRDGSRLLAAALLAALLTSHLLTGLTLLAVVVVWPLAARRGVARTLAVLGGGVAASAWLLVPSWIDRGSTSFANPEGTFWRDSYGTGRVLSWLGRGDLFDAGRLPVLTVLGAVGFVVVVVGRRHRALVVMLGVSLVLFCGTSLVGPVADRMPMREVLFLHRMIVGVHFAGILLAGIGVATVVRAMPRLPRLQPQLAVPAAVGALALALVPGWTGLRSYLNEQGTWVGQQAQAEAVDGRDFAALVGLAQQEGGRIYAGGTGNWGRDYRIGHVPGYIELLNLGADGVGFTGRVPALTEPSEGLFDPESRAQADMFDVRWQIRPATLAGPPEATLVAVRGRHRLWRTSTSGSLQVAGAGAAIPVGREGMALASLEFLRSDLALRGVYPLMGRASGRATPTGPGTPGRIVAAASQPDEGRYAATVSASRAAVVVVKTSSHRRWAATVDGRAARTEVVAPGLLAVPVPAGDHQVTVRYEGFPLGWRLALIAVGVGGLLTLRRGRGGLLRL